VAYISKRAKLQDEFLGLGHAFEIDPKQENALLYEIAHAQLTRELFPKAPLKYMPPTKYKSTDVFFSHCLDTMFNLASVTTKQGIHLTGILTEAIHTPFMMDRYESLTSVDYVFNIAKDLGDELVYKEDGIIQTRAKEVLNQVEEFLNKVKSIGLMKAIECGEFADIKRPIEGGKGLEGVFRKGPTYSNPVMDRLRGLI
jgi:beta-lysine 5,6-aminomutase alpha subunit